MGGNPFKSDTTPFTLFGFTFLWRWGRHTTIHRQPDVTNGGLRHKEYDGTRSLISPTTPGGHALRVNECERLVSTSDFRIAVNPYPDLPIQGRAQNARSRHYNSALRDRAKQNRPLQRAL